MTTTSNLNDYMRIKVLWNITPFTLQLLLVVLESLLCRLC